LQQGQATPRSRINWAKLLGIREDEEQAMRTVTADAWSRIKRIEDQGREEGEAYRRDPTPERRENFYAHGKEIGRERTEILDETIAKLRQELGEDGTKSLDAYLYRTGGWQKLLKQALIQQKARTPPETGVVLSQSRPMGRSHEPEKVPLISPDRAPLSSYTFFWYCTNTGRHSMDDV